LLRLCGAVEVDYCSSLRNAIGGAGLAYDPNKRCGWIYKTPAFFCLLKIQNEKISSTLTLQARA
jgi:hypothetical protein